MHLQLIPSLLLIPAQQKLQNTSKVTRARKLPEHKSQSKVLLQARK